MVTRTVKTVKTKGKPKVVTESTSESFVEPPAAEPVKVTEHVVKEEPKVTTQVVQVKENGSKGGSMLLWLTLSTLSGLFHPLH